MTLITCTECGNGVSTNAAACPKCGNPVSTGGRAGVGIKSLLILLVFWPVRIFRVFAGFGIGAGIKGAYGLVTAIGIKYNLEQNGLGPLADHYTSHSAQDAAYIIVGIVSLPVFALLRRILVALFHAARGFDHPSLSKRFWAL